MTAHRAGAAITIFQDRYAREKREANFTFDALHALLREPPTRPNKERCQLLKGARFGEARSERNSLRHDANVLAITAVEGDYDKEELSLDWAAERLRAAGVQALLYTSPSYRADAPRWRVICMLSREHSPEEHSTLVARLNGVLDGQLGGESFTLSQSYYFGRVNGSPYDCLRIDGTPLDLLPELDTNARGKPESEEKPGGEKRHTRQKQRFADDAVAARLRERGLVLHERTDGALDITCPFDNEHTTQSSPSATVYFLPNTGGYASGHFDCKHGHCVDRPQTQFLAALGLSEKLKPEWPKLRDEALHGLVGEFVRAIEPETESDPVAILVQLLVAFGAYVGRGPHVRVESDEHHCNLFAVLVGVTGKGRKGTSLNRVREPFLALPSPTKEARGLSTGEGLKAAVRDELLDADGKVKEAGVTDKRLLVVESEFAQVLRVAQRQGNTLSVTIRCAWDSGDLATLNKSDPVVATGAHIAIIGHVTADELRADLNRTDGANGFANRFLYVCVKRSKCLPFGGKRLDLTVFKQRLEQAATAARRLKSVEMTPAARVLWEKLYPVLSAGAEGLFGSVTARAEAQCLRLALVYALIDEKQAIDEPHLRAALAVWSYCEESARYVFGSSLGDPVADEVLRALRGAGKDGRTRTEIRDLFARHQNAERIDAALQLLAKRNLARCEQRKTGGRPTEVWLAV